MGNCCSNPTDQNETKVARIQRAVKPLQISVTGKEEQPQDFGNKIDTTYFKPDKAERALALIKQYGLYKFDLSVADLRGSEKNPVKQGSNEDFVYQGQFLGQHMHGKGHLLTKAGDLYVSPFFDNYAQGTGAVYFANGNYFFGRLTQGDLDIGKMVYSNGQVYVGEFRNGLRNGKGSLLYLDGSKYEGRFLDDLEHGEGRVTAEGIFEKGKKVQTKKISLDPVRFESEHIVGQPPASAPKPQEVKPAAPEQKTK